LVDELLAMAGAREGAVKLFFSPPGAVLAAASPMVACDAAKSVDRSMSLLYIDDDFTIVRDVEDLDVRVESSRSGWHYDGAVAVVNGGDDAVCGGSLGWADGPWRSMMSSLSGEDVAVGVRYLRR
jgi:hypothetical protein